MPIAFPKRQEYRGIHTILISKRITWAKSSKKLQISDSKIAHLLKTINKLPPDVISKLKVDTP
jgi:hypothetical protein